jgi:hypothetical protein
MVGKKKDNCWVKTDWLDAGEGAENPNWYRYENFDKAYEIALSESNKTTPGLRYKNGNNLKIKQKQMNGFLIIKGRMALLF